MARVAAPVSALGIVFHHPLGFAAVAAVTSLVGAVLLLVRPVELAVSGWLAGPTRVPLGRRARAAGTDARPGRGSAPGSIRAG